MTSHVKTVAILTARPGKVGDLLALLSALVEPSRAEPGNLGYDLWVDQSEPGRFVLDELYVDAAAVTAHRATPHFQNYLAHINELGDRTAITLDAIAVA